MVTKWKSKAKINIFWNFFFSPQASFQSNNSIWNFFQKDWFWNNSAASQKLHFFFKFQPSLWYWMRKHKAAQQPSIELVSILINSRGGHTIHGTHLENWKVIPDCVDLDDCSLLSWSPTMPAALGVWTRLIIAINGLCFSTAAEAWSPLLKNIRKKFSFKGALWFEKYSDSKTSWHLWFNLFLNTKKSKCLWTAGTKKTLTW